MTLRRTVATPFRDTGRDRLSEGEFVVALSLDRDWFSADGAARVVELATREELLSRGEGELAPTFDPHGVDVPIGFAPGDDLLADLSTFERVLGAIVADGADEREAVATINRRQGDLAVTIEAAAVLVAHERGLDVAAAAERARSDLR